MIRDVCKLVVSESHSITVEDPPAALLCVPSVPRISAWDANPVVSASLHHHAKAGDVQTSVSVLLALGERRRGLVDDATQEQWLLAYLDLLARQRMWEIATQVTNHFSFCSVLVIVLRICH